MLVLKLPHSRHFMAESVGHLYVGTKSEMLGSPVQNLFMKQPRRLSKLSRECKLLVIAKRVTGWRSSYVKSITLERGRAFWKTGKVEPEPLAVSLDEIHIDDKLHFVEEPVEILEREIKKLRRIRIPIIKVRWNSKRGPEFTWEREDQF
ncbi:hypothetical protein Tco_0464146 [Tanacetum coccineum]